jgi:hypothetical protein
MSAIPTVISAVAAAVLAGILWRKFLNAKAKRADQGRVLFEPVYGLFVAHELKREQTVGVWTLTGRYRDHLFQLKSVVDTLATRKLPSLWLMVTLQEPQPVSATTDLMMRAAAPSSFSNFDFLPHTIATPQGFPEQATIRSDVATAGFATHKMARHLDVFHFGRGKEFLVSPNGLRIVIQLAEGDRARYGVLREASFENVQVETNLVQQVMDTLIDMRNDLRNHEQT